MKKTDNVIDIDTGKPTTELVTRDIQVNDWTLTKINEETEPFVSDTILAVRLQYKQPRNIRKLIVRLIGGGDLKPEEVRSKSSQIPGKAGRPGTEYFLSESGALKVAAHSETEMGKKILDEVIRVFVLARRGMLPPVPQPQTAPSSSLSMEQVEQIVSMTVAATMKAVAPLLQQAQPRPVPQSTQPEPVYDFPVYQKPAPSGAPAMQRELLPEGERFRWYFAWALQRQWGVENAEFWNRFRQAGGKRSHQRKAINAKGYQIREDIVDKMLVDLNHQRR